MLQCRAALEAQGVASAWLTLDRADNQVRRFAQRLGRAVHDLTGYEQLEELSEEAVNSLRRSSTPFAIFLDSFEVIDEMTIFTLLRTLIEQLPRGGRLVIGTRNAPKLPLARLRALCILLELDVDDLRFSLDETALYLRLRCLPSLTRDSLVRLHDKRGWITGLWLASMSIERQARMAISSSRFSGSTKTVADYLTEEVLAYQSEEIRQFLLCTSILRQLNVSLCRAVLPDYDVERILRKLEEQNLFLLPAPGERTIAIIRCSPTICIPVSALSNRA